MAFDLTGFVANLPMPTFQSKTDLRRIESKPQRPAFQLSIRSSLSVWQIALTCFIVGQLIGCNKDKPQIGLVVGSSMSPGMVGEHYLARCDACEFEFKCDIEQANQRRHLVCPNCGNQIERTTCEKRKPDVVDVQLSDYTIERWDVVAFQMPPKETPTEKEVAGIKRVVGLPGESIEFRGGNLVANGSIVRKNLAQQKGMRLLVYDTRYRPKHSRHWAIPDGSKWKLGDTFEFNPNGSNDAIEWFGFRGQKNYSHSIDENLTQESANIEDFYAFNQSLSRDLHPMDEIFVTMDVRVSEDSILAWRFNHRGTIFEFQIDTQHGTLQVKSTDSKIPATSVPLGELLPNSKLIVEFSSIDLQLQAWVNGTSLFHHELSETDAPIARELLKFGAANNRVVFDRIRIWRDLYYFPDENSRSSAPMRVSEDGVFVIGDNVPISVDSRYWLPPSIPKSRILGKVKLP